MIKVFGQKIGANITPKRKALVVSKWLREEFKMPFADRIELKNEAIDISNKAAIRHGDLHRNISDPKWQEQQKANYGKEIGFVEKIFGAKVTNGAMSDHALAYYHLRNTILQTLTTGKFSGR